MTASRFRVLGRVAHGIALGAVLLGVASAAEAAPVVRRANGATASDIQATVDQFRTDLGGANNGRRRLDHDRASRNQLGRRAGRCVIAQSVARQTSST